MNKLRISNQIENLNKHKNLLVQYNIQPVFVTGDEDIQTGEYECIRLDNFQEKYTNLARKTVYSLEHLCQNYKFDYLIKMDDDVVFNVDQLDLEVFKYDYVGKFFNSFTKNEITIDLPSYNIREVIELYPSAFSDSPFKFAAGNFYVLSRKAAKIVADNKNLLEDFYKETVRISEDQFVGYCLQKQNITKHDYGYETPATRDLILQITRNLTTFHPVSDNLFMKLIRIAPQEQLKMIMQFSSLTYRRCLLEKLKSDIKNVIFDFANSKKLSGMG